eukprot:TRINITY_DN32435_c0_g1_i1.p1 TRINITY_DN32435_c0_g1~~TRINITY_DN32435_c0_g1_i1.p1  ORF type:complete len:257 (+),score=41.23 TRINITY_DN32435_c0_g1_i1:150-920(+)
MPVELWLECICADTFFGEELVVVGDHPSLGCWNVWAAVPLVTSAEDFPRWYLEKPLVLEQHPGDLPAYIEYKYVVRGHDRLIWEELGVTERLPRFSASVAATNASDPAARQLANITRARNRRLPASSRERLLPAHGVLISLDRFCLPESVVQGAWSVAPSWKPACAGHVSDLEAERYVASSRDSGAFEEKLPPHWRIGSRILNSRMRKLAVQIFVQPRRSQLLGCLLQLSQKHRLPRGLYWRIAELVGGDADAKLR